MSLKSIIAAALVGISSVASAQPITSAHFSGSFDGGLHIRDHRSAARTGFDSRQLQEPAYSVRPYTPRWMNLGTFGVTADRAQIDFDVGRRPMRQLFLRQNGWKTRLFSIDIIYANGRTRRIDMDTYLGDVGDRGSMTMSVDLPRSRVPIDQIVITASNARNSSFSVYGI